MASIAKKLLLAIEVSEATWLLCFSDGNRRRQRKIVGWDQRSFRQELSRALKSFGLVEGTEVCSCYEAGRDGNSLHRFLQSVGIENKVVDASSLQVERRMRRRKTDRLDVEQMINHLVRYHMHGERGLWREVRVPSEEQEAEGRLHRERQRLLKERNGHVCRIKSLLALHGVRVSRIKDLDVAEVRDWAGRPLGEPWQEEIKREQQRLEMIEEQIAELEAQRDQRLKSPQTEADRVAAKLMGLRSIGATGAWELSKEFFGRRKFNNRRQVGSLAGLTGSPYCSGQMNRDQGISKAGNWRVRTLGVELAWMWLRWQPQSALSQWYNRRFASGSKRQRRIGIVALARKLLVALWKYLEFNEIPEGAVLKKA
jgi:transposase